MTFPVEQLPPDAFPPLVREIPDPPNTLFIRGVIPPKQYTYLCVVGSRKYTMYGKQACQSLLRGLAGYPVAIISGLALGMDAIAHTTALEIGLKTIAVPGSGLNDEVLYPRTNAPLARRILASGGALLSEFEPNFKAELWSFPKRNRIMAGMSHATLLIEAEERSGTLITARMTTDYNRELLVVPGSIFSESTKGVHQFLKLGATPVTSSKDILDALGIQEKEAAQASPARTLTPDEEMIFELLNEPLPRDVLIEQLDMPISEINILLSAMELKNLIVEEMGLVRIV